MLRTSDLDYVLPEGRIATRPAEPRDAARLLVVSRSDERMLERAHVRDLARFVGRGDAMVFNTTRVLPARLLGRKPGTGGLTPGLFVGAHSPTSWTVLLKGHRLRAGTVLEMLGAGSEPTGVSLLLVERDQEGWRAEVRGAPAGEDVAGVLARIGATPLPPYILKARREEGESPADDLDRRWYQTVYARERAWTRDGGAGSVAAPTAGLHFTPELLDRLEGEAGVRRLEVALHVGLGTFRPVETEFVEDHPIHEEWCEVGGETLAAIDERRAAGGRVVAVGTTTARALESVPAGWVGDWRGRTHLLITPGHEWRRVDGLMTNFHLPRSTLLAMAAALFPGGVGRLLSIYRRAIEEGYRFYSYGDAMLILP